MSLIVAGISDSGGIHLVAETKITWAGDPLRTSQVWANPWRKLLILRSDLAVGITGAGYEEACQHLVTAARHGSADHVAWAASDLADSDVLVASLDPTRLVRTRFGNRRDETASRRAWAGDESAYDKFQIWESPYFGGVEDLGLQAPMQTLANLGAHGSVGGYTLRVDTHDNAFQFTPTPMVVPGAFEACVLAGARSTPGALGIHLPRCGTGYLYSQEQPWEPIEVSAERCEDLVGAAADVLGQALALGGGCRPMGTVP